MRRFFPQKSLWASNNHDSALDVLLNYSGLLRFGITEPLVRHMGNILSTSTINILSTYNYDPGKSGFSNNKSWIRIVTKNRVLKKIALKIHIWTFNLLYG
jgi:hypothetical protein